jgi:hypothetical protein
LQARLGVLVEPQALHVRTLPTMVPFQPRCLRLPAWQIDQVVDQERTKAYDMSIRWDNAH